MNDAYSPHTGEHIATDSPAPWMGRAGVPAPEYDPQAYGCFWRGDAWELVAAQPAKPPVPQSCTPAQGLVALFAVKQITEDDLLAAIDRITDPVQQYTARIGLQRATIWERESQTMQNMAVLLGLTEQDLDELFEYTVNVLI